MGANVVGSCVEVDKTVVFSLDEIVPDDITKGVDDCIMLVKPNVAVAVASVVGGEVAPSDEVLPNVTVEGGVVGSDVATVGTLVSGFDVNNFVVVVSGTRAAAVIFALESPCVIVVETTDVVVGSGDVVLDTTVDDNVVTFPNGTCATGT